MPKLIDTLNLPAGLRELQISELEVVAKELREELIDTVSSSGGHFASSLGAAELSVALHHCFETPHDRLVWDVGHQAYIHKMLTGRRQHMQSIRQKGGLSGFLKRNESEFDSFGAGHAGTSISAAVGMAVALKAQNSDHSNSDRSISDRYAVAIIGDGSLTAGMAFEALNNAGGLGLKNLIVVLNDNEMSISPNVGAISWCFSKAITSKTSTIARAHFKNLYKKGYVPEFIYRAIDKAEEAAQGFMAGPAMLFESFGFRYIGPVDGHDMTDLLTALNNAKHQDVPVLVHVCTVKGKGYEPAEEDPVLWHGVTPFDRHRGKFTANTTSAASSSASKPCPSYTSIFAESLIELAKHNPKIIAITAAMPTGTGLDKFQKALPQQFFDVGICEQHAVTFAAGLACEGYKPVCAIYSTFLQRAYDQVIHDVCIQNLPVVFAIDRAGLVGNDGETHQGVFDISFLRTLPNIIIMSPKDEAEFRDMLNTALQHPGPVAIRYPRGNGVGVDLNSASKQIEIGKAALVRTGQQALIVALGPLVGTALQAAELAKRDLGIDCAVINARFAKPLDIDLLSRELPKYQFIITLEDHSIQAGFGSAILELINQQAITIQNPLLRLGVTDCYAAHASQAEQHAHYGFDTKSIVGRLEDFFKTKPAVNGFKQAVGL